MSVIFAGIFAYVLFTQDGDFDDDEPVRTTKKKKEPIYHDSPVKIKKDGKWI